MSETDTSRNGVDVIEGHVALIDILGFRSIVSGAKFAEKFKPYSRAVESATANGRLVEYLVFSDTIVMYDSRSASSVEAIASCCSKLFDELVQLEFPFRGCVSYGEFSRFATPRGVLIAGPPIIDAYRYEQRQDWIGIMLSPSVLQQHWSNRDKDHPFSSVKQYIRVLENIPLRNERGGNVEDFRGFAIVPCITGTGDKLKYARIINQLKRLCMTAPDGATQRKYHNTLQFLRHVKCVFLKEQEDASAGGS